MTQVKELKKGSFEMSGNKKGTGTTKNTKTGAKLTSIRGGKGGGDTTDQPRIGSRTRTAPDADNFGNTASTAPTGTNVVDFTSVRAQRSLDNRRTFERFFMQHIVDAYCELAGGREMVPLELVEVSETGCSYRIPSEKTSVLPRDTTGAILPIQMRLYFSKDSYLRIGMFVVNQARDIAHHGNSTRFGCRVDETFASSEAYRGFVRFMEQFSNHAARDAKHFGSGA